MNNKLILLFTLLLLLSIPLLAQFTAVTSGTISNEELESKGVAWVDYDNDGDDDLFVTISTYSSLSRKDLLFNNNGDGTFTKILIGDLVNEEGAGRNSTWADFNNDGLPDVFITNQHETFLYKNLGSGVFAKQSSIPTTAFSFDSDHSGAAWGDYNGDGYIDLFLSSYKLNDNAINVLYLNNKDESFTQSLSTDVISTHGSSVDPAWIDYDNNGTLDLFVPNYCSNNFLYKNLGNGNFSSVSDNVLLPSNCSVGSSWAALTMMGILM
ncbi:MAG: VCBS repeat-containing protein [Cyclobacteriaceae bacterium]|nr:VCBS repeat-containing protein [Cyclobacteriaceae bacterium]